MDADLIAFEEWKARRESRDASLTQLSKHVEAYFKAKGDPCAEIAAWWELVRFVFPDDAPKLTEESLRAQLLHIQDTFGQPDCILIYGAASGKDEDDER